jgi:hypothetical protein
MASTLPLLTLFPQENNACADQVNMYQTRQRALLTSTPSPRRPWWLTIGTTIIIDLSDLVLPGSHYTRRVTQLAVRLVVEDGLPYRPASWQLWRDHRVFVPFATIQTWPEAGGKKGARTDGQRGSGLGACVVFGLRGS